MRNMFKVNNKDIRTTSLRRYVVLMTLLLILNVFHIFSTASIVNYEQVSVCS